MDTYLLYAHILRAEAPCSESKYKCSEPLSVRDHSTFSLDLIPSPLLGERARVRGFKLCA